MNFVSRFCHLEWVFCRFRSNTLFLVSAGCLTCGTEPPLGLFRSVFHSHFLFVGVFCWDSGIINLVHMHIIFHQNVQLKVNVFEWQCPRKWFADWAIICWDQLVPTTNGLLVIERMANFTKGAMAYSKLTCKVKNWTERSYISGIYSVETLMVWVLLWFKPKPNLYFFMFCPNRFLILNPKHQRIQKYTEKWTKFVHLDL
jgi:hypothetical protein